MIVAILVGGLLLLVATAMLAIPYLQVVSWKSATLTTVNTSVDSINETNQAISEANLKLQPTAEDLTKAEQAFSDQLTAIQTAQSNVGEVNTFGVDVFGATDGATNTRAELMATYSELEALAASGKAQAASDREVFVALGSGKAAESLEQSILYLTKAAILVDKAAKNGVQTEFNTRYAEGIREFVGVIAKAPTGAVTEADLEAASKKFDAYTQEQIDLMSAEQKKVDAAIERLNAAAKQLE